MGRIIYLLDIGPLSFCECTSVVVPESGVMLAPSGNGYPRELEYCCRASENTQDDE